MTKRPLINHKFDQIIEAQRPRHVTPGGRSGCWERPQVVAVGRRSQLVCRSQIDTTRATSGCRCGDLALESTQPERPQGVAVVTSLWRWSEFMASLR